MSPERRTSATTRALAGVSKLPANVRYTFAPVKDHFQLKPHEPTPREPKTPEPEE